MRRLRGGVVGQAHGRVLELGAGIGPNIEHFDSVERVVLTELDPEMVKRLERRLRDSSMSGKVVRAPAEQLPWSGCSRWAKAQDWVARWLRDPLPAAAVLRTIRQVSWSPELQRYFRVRVELV
jgi:hypothetical protein